MNDRTRLGDEPRQLSELIRSGIFEYLKDVHTALPGIIDSFDAKTQLASVRPAVKRVFRSSDGEGERLDCVELPLVIRVPVVFPSGNGWHLTFPVKPGNECLLIFSERTIQEWRTQGGVREPSNKRFHSLTDGIAIMGLHSEPQAIKNYSQTAIELRTNGNKISIDNGLTTLEGNVKINGDVEINGDTTQKGNIAQTGNVAQIGDKVQTGNVQLTGGQSVSGNLAIAGGLSNKGTNVGAEHVHPQGPDSDGDSQSTTGRPQ